MSDLSQRLSLPYLQPAQAQKHVTHNEALRRLDALVQLSVLDRDRTAPPAAPAEGDRHVVAAGADAAWSGKAGHLAVAENGTWVFCVPAPGWRAWVEAEGREIVFDGAGWTVAGGELRNLDGLGVGGDWDATNRFAVAAAGSLFSHAGTGHRLTVNKAAAADTGALLFQTGFSGRAEIGLTGTDDLSVKVSADGAAFATALEVDRATARVRVPGGLTLGAGSSVLDAYGEATWTPGLSAATTAPAGVASTGTGHVVRVGRLVFASFDLAVSGKGTGGAGAVQITGLPVASGGTFQSSGLHHAGVTFPGTGAPLMRSGGTTLTLSSTNGIDLLWSGLPAGSFGLAGTVVYRAA